MSNYGSMASMRSKHARTLNRYIPSVIHAISIYNGLYESDKKLVPDSLINALCHYAGIENVADIKPAENLKHMSDLTCGIMSLFLLYSGTDSRSKAISDIKESCGAKERQVIKEILLLKKMKYEKP